MYARNVTALLELLAPKGTLNVDMNDEIIRGACVAHDGRVRYPPAPVTGSAGASR
jgi:NAD(P) transhydrogenase subunit alpha